ncbi:hypothetical protein H2198_009449 [Neophaeococcomyces mojaviensis]|uniref:Uncharacterized protein n=1 Tax=Neophaeococcomyces mojaviensis TaxID=3383035 RepID=A0ACC2ZUF7_9EURO|nr:hypothetical protein H2198_009449 [Knufia sp. JES_112]
MSPQSKHVRSLLNAEPFYDSELGSLRKIDVDTLPILKNLSIKRLVLAPGTIREPHWHANCNELAYCLRGQLLISILDNGNEFSSFAISAGNMFHITSGSLHYIENVGKEEAECIITFRHEKPEDFSLQASFGAMSDAVLGNTYDQPASQWAKIARDTSPKYIVKRSGLADFDQNDKSIHLGNAHKFDVEGMSPPIKADIGSARTARKQFWPILDNISMYSLRVEEDGMREPHWHPETAEMGYVHQGRARMSIMDPDGSVDTYTLKPGDMYFIPRAYPHQIEVLGDEQIHFLIFFDQPTPQDIGYRTSATLMSRNVIAATFGVEENALPIFPITTKDPLIVAKSNKLDPVIDLP